MAVRTTYGKLIKGVVLHRPLQLHIPVELAISENVEPIEKDKNKSLQSIIENHGDITPDKNIENRRSKRSAPTNANIMNK